MTNPPEKSDGAFRTIREVADWLGVPTHVLRFWESKFEQIAPVKGAGGRRYYRPEDMRLLGGIKVMLHDEGLTIRAVGQKIEDEGVNPVMALSPEMDSVEGPPQRTRRVIRHGDDSENGRVLPFDAGQTPAEPESTPADNLPAALDSPADGSAPDPLEALAEDEASDTTETPAEEAAPELAETTAEVAEDAAVDSLATQQDDKDATDQEWLSPLPDPPEGLPDQPTPEAPLPAQPDAPAAATLPEAPEPAPAPDMPVETPDTPDPVAIEMAPTDPDVPAAAPARRGTPRFTPVLTAPLDTDLAPTYHALRLARAATGVAPENRVRLRRVIRRYRALVEEISEDLNNGDRG